MPLDLLAGLAQGFAQAQKDTLAQEEQKELRKLQVKMFQRQLDMEDQKKAAGQKLMELLAPAMLPMNDFAENSGAPMGQPQGKNLRQVLASPEGQQAALGAGYNLNDIQKFQTPDITELLANGQIANAMGSGGGMKLSAIKIGPDGRPMIDFENTYDKYKEGQAERDAARLYYETGAGGVPGNAPSTNSTAPNIPGITPKQKAEIAAEAAKDQTKKAIQAGNVIDLIGQAKKYLGDATGSLPGDLLNQGKSALGISDKSTQANTQLKLISGWLVSNVPRMEGPQSEFDVKNYQEMAGKVGDSKIPIKDRLAALNTLADLQKKYAQPGKVLGEDPLGIR